MTELRESVRIVTPGGELEGYLYVGIDGLPELRVLVPCPLHPPGVDDRSYRPATLPAAWRLRYIPRDEPPILSACWFEIDRIRRQIQDAQREAEQETPNG